MRTNRFSSDICRRRNRTMTAGHDPCVGKTKLKILNYNLIIIIT